MSSKSEIPYRDLGRTGERVSCLDLGGWRLSLPDVSRSSPPASSAPRSIFDSTAKNPKWLGEEPDRIADLMPA